MPLLLLPWRGALVVWLSLAPWAAPLEARASGDPRGYAAAGLLFFALVAALIVRRVETHGRGDRVALALTGGSPLPLAPAALLPRAPVALSTAAGLVPPLRWGGPVPAWRPFDP